MAASMGAAGDPAWRKLKGGWRLLFLHSCIKMVRNWLHKNESFESLHV